MAQAGMRFGLGWWLATWSECKARLMLCIVPLEAADDGQSSPFELDESMCGMDPVARLNPVNPYNYHAPEYLSGIGFGMEEMRGHERDFR